MLVRTHDVERIGAIDRWKYVDSSGSFAVHASSVTRTTQPTTNDVDTDAGTRMSDLRMIAMGCARRRP